MIESSKNKSEHKLEGARPKDQDLALALQENLAHARHLEILRQRHNYLYWIAWGAALGFVYARDGKFEDYPLIFLLLVILSCIVLLATLKSSAEFANHMNAAHAISKALNLNVEQKVITPIAGPASKTVFAHVAHKMKELIRIISKPLPYEEFRGYMALPLRMPIFLNVAFLLPVLQCVSLALAVGLFLYGCEEQKGLEIFGKTIYLGSITSSVISAIVAFCLGVTVCVWSYFRMGRELRRRNIDKRDFNCSNKRINTD